MNNFGYNVGHNDSVTQAYKRILSYNFVSNKDFVLNTAGGMLGSKLITHDIFNKKFEEFTLDYFNKTKEDNRIEQNFSRDNLIYFDEQVNYTNSKVYLHPTSIINDYKDSQHYGSFRAEWPYDSSRPHDWLLKYKQKIFELNNSLQINMDITGNTTLTVGDTINISLPSSSDEDEDIFYSGKYLISKLRHTFDNANKTHVIGIGAIRDSLPTRIQ